jgi:NAD(P)-dependent dehydrogenase (short-subunit alcohol dehydrogenase family)
VNDIAHLQSDNVLPLQLDITASPEIVKKVVDDAINTFGGVDVLVNNAGYLHGAFIEEAELVLFPLLTKCYSRPAAQKTTSTTLLSTSVAQ